MRLLPRLAGSRWVSLGLLALAAGCKGCSSDEALPQLLEEEDATPVGAWVGVGLGASPVQVPVFATSALGAAVPTDSIGLTSDGTVAATVTPAADGWAFAEVSAAGVGRYGLEATAGTAVADGAAVVVDTAPGQLDYPAIPAGGTASQVVPTAPGGVAWSVDGDVWWAAWQGAPPVRVLALAEPVVGLLPAQLDSDGLTDLVVWSAEHVVVLRGRDGGLVWGDGWSVADDRTVQGVAVGDPNGDAVADLVIALSGTEDAWVEIFSGDGLWGFSAADALELGYPVFGVSTEDLDGNGVWEVTVLTEDGLLRRYTHVDGDWASTLSSNQYALEIGAGSRLLPSTDLTGDGIPEIVAVGPSLDGAGWEAWVVTAGATEPSQYKLIADSARPEWLGLALGDLDGDGVSDLILSQPDKLVQGSWIEQEPPEDDTFKLLAYTTLPGSGAVALDDIDADGVTDVIVGGSTLQAIPGLVEEDGWRTRPPTPTVFGLDLLLEPALQDIDGDAIVDLVALVPTGGGAGVAVQGFHGIAATDTTNETFRSGGVLSLSSSGAPVALAVCGARAFALYDEVDDTGTPGTWLARIDLGANVVAQRDGDPISVVGDTLTCGAFAAGEVAVADAAGGLSYVDAAGAVTAGESLGAVGAIAAADPDGTGVDGVVACAEVGCTIAAADLDGDGLDEVVTQDSTGTTVLQGGELTTLVETGVVRLSDADGDGRVDIVFGDAGVADVVRGVPGGFTPAVASWIWRPVGDAVQYGDLDGDGLPDAFLFGVDLDPDTDDYDDWAGALVYATAAE